MTATPVVVEVTSAQVLDWKRALMMQAREALQDEDACQALDKWLRHQPDQVKAYSEQNQMMLFIQCAERGLKRLTQLHTFKGWLNVGRAVTKGEKAFVVSSKVSSKVTDDETGERLTEVDGSPKQSKLKGFQWLMLFDESQTEVKG